MNFNIKNWIQVSLLNLSIVAFLGVLMRFKIGFEFPYFNQKYLQYAHSHFAFAGWITLSIYILLIQFLHNHVASFDFRPYRKLLLSNLVCAYGMLISFAIQGYGFVSILFSSGTIVLACFFAWIFFNDLKQVASSNPAKNWFKAALWFNIFSSIGTIYLAYIMVSHNFNENWYLAAVYFYLHFQYNGFFVFSCIGFSLNEVQRILPEFTYKPLFFKLFFISVIPAYFLSTLWADLPLWLYSIVVLAAIVQVYGWIKILQSVRSAIIDKINLPKLAKFLIAFVTLAYTLKLFLQLGSTIPSISKLAFGFRPIVIAYLHLVLLAVISVFLLSYFYTTQLMKQNKVTNTALLVFVAGVFLNELVLAVQGIASFSYTPVKYVNEILFAVSLVLLSGTLMIWRSQKINQH